MEQQPFDDRSHLDRPSDEQPLLGLEVDFDSGNKFNEASGWARFIAIVIFVGIGLSLLSLLLLGAAFTRIVQEAMPVYGQMGNLLFGVILVVLAIYTYLTILLYRFANLVKQGIQSQDQGLFNDGLRNLKNYFLIQGVFALLSIVMNALGVLGRLF